MNNFLSQKLHARWKEIVSQRLEMYDYVIGQHFDFIYARVGSKIKLVCGQLGVTGSGCVFLIFRKRGLL